MERVSVAAGERVAAPQRRQPAAPRSQVAAGPRGGVAALVGLQAAAGNRAVAALLRSTRATPVVARAAADAEQTAWQPPPTIRFGSQGEVVRDAQSRLNAAGADLAVDGIFGPLTRAAAVAFQRGNGLAADGIIGPVTWRGLVAGTARAAGAETAGGADTLTGLRDRLASVSFALRNAVDAARAQAEGGGAAGSAGGRRRPVIPRTAGSAVGAPGDVGVEILGLASDVLATLDAHSQVLAAEYGDEIATLEGIATSLASDLPDVDVGAVSGGLDAVAHGLATKATTGKPVVSSNARGSTTITVTTGAPLVFNADSYQKLYELMDQRAQRGLESGSTESQISDYAFDAEPVSGGGFRVKKATLEVTETTHGCTWPQEGNACDKDRAQWKAYQQAIDTHEAGHVGVDKKAFANGHERWHGLTAPTEAELQSKVDEAVAQLETDAGLANDAWHKTPAGAVPALPPSACG
ncbi:MAG TPA: peptidoglycan-binding domain-containing protein [Egibacteraceae bacterium]